MQKKVAAATPVEPKTVDEELQERLAALSQLKLQSVLVIGERPSSVIIANNLLTVGEMIEGWKVVEIHATKAVLQYKEHKKTLELPE